MNEMTNMHAPTPEFRAALEDEIVRALHRDEQLPPSARTARGRRLRTAIALAAGSIFGVGTNFAAGQVQDSRQRDTLTSAMAASQQLAAVRFELAQAAYDQARTAFEMGAVTRASLLAAEADVRAARGKVAKLELDLQEIRVTAAPPRDELWAPLAGGRDFMKERMALEAADAQQRLTATERAALEAERAFRAGVITQGALREAQNQVSEAMAQLEAHARQMRLREEFVAKGAVDNRAVEEMMRTVQQLQLELGLHRAERDLTLAQARAAVARDRRATGVVGDLDVKRAELDVLERSVEVQRLRLELAKVSKK